MFWNSPIVQFQGAVRKMCVQCAKFGDLAEWTVWSLWSSLSFSSSSVDYFVKEDFKTGLKERLPAQCSMNIVHWSDPQDRQWYRTIVAIWHINRFSLQRCLHAEQSAQTVWFNALASNFRRDQSKWNFIKFMNLQIWKAIHGRRLFLKMKSEIVKSSGTFKNFANIKFANS